MLLTRIVATTQTAPQYANTRKIGFMPAIIGGARCGFEFVVVELRHRVAIPARRAAVLPSSGAAHGQLCGFEGRSVEGVNHAHRSASEKLPTQAKYPGPHAVIWLVAPDSDSAIFGSSKSAVASASPIPAVVIAGRRRFARQEAQATGIHKLASHAGNASGATVIPTRSNHPSSSTFHPGPVWPPAVNDGSINDAT